MEFVEQSPLTVYARSGVNVLQGYDDVSLRVFFLLLQTKQSRLRKDLDCFDRIP